MRIVPNRIVVSVVDREEDNDGRMSFFRETVVPSFSGGQWGGPAGTLVTYETDDFGNVVTVTGQWANGSTRQRFDAAGRLRERRTPSLAAPERQEYQYDALGRPTKALLASAGTVLWQMGYDGSTAAWTNCPPAGVTHKGKVQWKDDSFGRTWYRYDAMGNVLELKRVRAGATSCAASASSTDANPDTTFTYDSLQRLSTMKYPHGLNVMYEYGDALGRPHEVTGIKVNFGEGWVQLLSSITWDVGGELRDYTINSNPAVQVGYSRKGPALSAANCTYNPTGTDDGSGRLTTMLVKRGTTNLMMRRYLWNAEMLSGQETCWMGATTPTVDSFGVDALGQVTAATHTNGSSNEGEAFVYEFGSDKKREASNSNTQTYWEDTYDSKRRLLFQEPRASMSSTTASSWYRRDFFWDNDGRMSFFRETVVPYFSGGQWGWLPGQAIDLTANNGFGSVYSQMLVNGAAYQYFYDAQGRRRLKMYPNGTTDEFFYDGEHLIEDRGLTSPQAITLTYPIDQYVWLGNMPVAVIRQYFNSSMVRQTGATDCTRNGDSAQCGTFYIVNDYLPKPVALVNSEGRLAGIGEYDTFGRVNRVALRVDAPAQPGAGGWPFGTYFSSNNATLATFSPALRGGLQGRARFDYSLVNAASGRPKGTGCACGVRIQCSWLRPGETSGKPESPRCMSETQAIQVGAAVGQTPDGRACRASAACHAWIPDCRSDKECPSDQVCICRDTGCTVQRRVWTYVQDRVPPYSTFMRISRKHLAILLDAGVTF